jgi:hypothetical protein
VKSMPRGIFMVFCFAVSILIILSSGNALIAADDDWYTWYEQQNAQGSAETPGEVSDSPDSPENPPYVPDGGAPEEPAPPEGSAGNLPPPDQPVELPSDGAPTWDYEPDEPAEQADAAPPEETPAEVAEAAENPSGGTTAALPDQIDWGASYDPYQTPEPSQPEAVEGISRGNGESAEEYGDPADESTNGRDIPEPDGNEPEMEEPENEDII